MYTPAHFEMQDRAELVGFMRRYNFATLVFTAREKLTAAHAPLVVREHEGGITLVGHLSRAGLATLFSDVLVIFTGPHAYVSPSLYESKQSVPTWNYTAVHAYGTAHAIEPEPALMELVDVMEPRYHQQWSALPDEYRAKMMAAVVAFEIRVDRLEGKYKLSQNRPVEDQRRVTEAFEGTELGEFMQKVRR